MLRSQNRNISTNSHFLNVWIVLLLSCVCVPVRYIHLARRVKRVLHSFSSHLATFSQNWDASSVMSPATFFSVRRLLLSPASTWQKGGTSVICTASLEKAHLHV